MFQDEQLVLMCWLAAALLLQSGRGRGRCNLNLEILISSTAAAQYIQLMHIYYLNFAATTPPDNGASICWEVKVKMESFYFQIHDLILFIVSREMTGR